MKLVAPEEERSPGGWRPPQTATYGGFPSFKAEIRMQSPSSKIGRSAPSDDRSWSTFSWWGNGLFFFFLVLALVCVFLVAGGSG